MNIVLILWPLPRLLAAKERDFGFDGLKFAKRRIVLGPARCPNTQLQRVSKNFPFVPVITAFSIRLETVAQA